MIVGLVREFPTMAGNIKKEKEIFEVPFHEPVEMAPVIVC
jgi:hypothetical protein